MRENVAMEKDLTIQGTLDTPAFTTTGTRGGGMTIKQPLIAEADATFSGELHAQKLFTQDNALFSGELFHVHSRSTFEGDATFKLDATFKGDLKLEQGIRVGGNGIAIRDATGVERIRFTMEPAPAPTEETARTPTETAESDS
jgi:cytoskeletal protein CcmA (bactofilin family)